MKSIEKYFSAIFQFEIFWGLLHVQNLIFDFSTFWHFRLRFCIFSWHIFVTDSRTNTHTHTNKQVSIPYSIEMKLLKNLQFDTRSPSVHYNLYYTPRNWVLASPPPISKAIVHPYFEFLYSTTSFVNVALRHAFNFWNILSQLKIMGVTFWGARKSMLLAAAGGRQWKC